jgi:para-nitrobenzyl esterase
MTRSRAFGQRPRRLVVSLMGVLAVLLGVAAEPLTDAGSHDPLAGTLREDHALPDPVQANSAVEAPLVATAEGMLRGSGSGKTDRWLGIPYAVPPIGNMRWRPPEPVGPWTGIREATDFASRCPQTASPTDPASTAEDCLYLDVVAPGRVSRLTGRLPVLVWIHGGAFVGGGSQDHDPRALAARGMVVVSINYRLGALGWMAHPALADADGSSGNYGWMDQQEALRWVQRNIRAFGGDPDNVTIGGTSAGGLSVLMHLVSPGSRGLFAKAIVQSGTFALTQTTLPDAEALGMEQATELGCPDQTAECLRRLPVPTLLNLRPGPAGFTPGVVDGRVLMRSVGDALADGEFAAVPVLQGTSRDEERLYTAMAELQGRPVTEANYESRLAARLAVRDDVASAIAAEYPVTEYSSPAIAFSTAVSDAAYACPALAVDLSLSRNVPTYAYEFADRTAPQPYFPPVTFPSGAFHTSEVQYLLALTTAPIRVVPGRQQVELAASMQSYWTAFAASGDPNVIGEVPWPAFDGPGRRVLSLRTPDPAVSTTFAVEHHCQYWSAVDAGR